MSETVLDVRNLQVEFVTDNNIVKAVDNISFQLHQGQTLGIVGESGSGKSVTSLAVMGLVPTQALSLGRNLVSRQMIVDPINLLQLPQANAAIPGRTNRHDLPRADEFAQPSLYMWVSADRSNTSPSACFRCIGATASDRQSPGSQTPPQ